MCNMLTYIRIALVTIACEQQTYFRSFLQKNNVCGLELRNDFHDVISFLFYLTNEIE